MTPADYRKAFAELRFDWARTPKDVWKSVPVHVEGLHADTARNVLAGISDASMSIDSSPLGLVVQGQAGSGKTHLLGWVREQVSRQGGYFFLVGPLSGTAFWESVASAVRDDLWRDIDGQGTQVTIFLRRLCSMIGVSGSIRDAVVGDTELGPADLKDFIVAFLRGVDRSVGRECQHTLRALVLYNSVDPDASEVGETYLMSMDEQRPNERSERGMRSATKPPREIVSEVLRLLALTGPNVVAVDQIDTIVADSTISTAGDDTSASGSYVMFDQVADGLLVLRDVTARTLVVLSCLPATWAVFEEKAVASVRDRFRTLKVLSRIESPAIGRELVAKHFEVCYRRIGFTPPYVTWPVKEAAFEQAPGYTPRALLQRIYQHVEACLSADTFTELDRLDNDEPSVGPGPLPQLDLSLLDKTFAELREAADGVKALTQDTEDTLVPALLTAGLAAWTAERGTAGQNFRHDGLPGHKPALHARLRLALDENTGDEMHWAFRAVTSTHGLAALARIREACTKSGVNQASRKRRLFLLRNEAWSAGAKTQEVIEAFETAGGLTLPFTDDDLRTFAALERMLVQNHPNLQKWLVERQWASRTALFANALRNAVPMPPAAPAPAAPTTTPATGVPTQAAQATAAPSRLPVGPTKIESIVVYSGGASASATGSTAASPTGNTAEKPPRPAPPAMPPPVARPSRITIGVDTGNQQPVGLNLETLRRHTVIFAGSGSGKTVLIRRMVEECALRGVSSIVLDPNNDLARLGDAWPEAPRSWSGEDAGLAKEYLDQTDVVVWTPRIASGRPLTFQPLPDFQSVRNSPDELSLALDTAMITLARKAGATGHAGKAKQARAVLHDTLRYFARGNRTTLASFVDLLSELPDGVTKLDPSGKIADGLATALRSEMVTDPMFGGQGEAADPGVLLTPAAGKRARISVISFVGLPGEEQRQNFVNQLQLALFSWAKKNPAGDRPLGGLFVMDEAQTFAPSGGLTACTRTTLMLASQVRKYGLGLVFATQAPKGLHSQISGNATTQFFGLLSAPVHIEAAKEMARTKGGDASQVGRLKTGQFYAASEGLRFRKIQTPLCLSYHPKSPLTEEEVVERARRPI